MNVREGEVSETSWGGDRGEETENRKREGENTQGYKG